MNAFIIKERLGYFEDMLLAAGWEKDASAWTAPLHFRDELAVEIGRGPASLWVAVAAQIQFDTAALAAITKATA